MSYRWTSGKSALIICGILLAAACSNSEFPTSPGPTAIVPITTVSGLKVTGTATLPGGAVTPMNMTLVARSVSITAQGTGHAQARGTTEVTGSYVLGTGVTGTVTGLIDPGGTLDNGTFRGSLSDDAARCSQQYAGPVSSSGIAFAATTPPSTCQVPTALQGTRQEGGGSACTFNVSPQTPSVSGSGGEVEIVVTTGSTCSWTVQPLDSFVLVVGSRTATGTGTVRLAVDANSGVARAARAIVAGQLVTINQGQACTFAVAPTSVTVPAGGGSGTVTVTVPSGCAWQVQNAPDWITASPSSGNSTQTITLTAQPNPGGPRQASFLVAGQTVTVTQPAGTAPLPSCTLSIVPTTASFPVAGGSGAVDITAPQGCNWTAQTDDPWIQLTSAATGSATGRVTFNVLENTGVTRTGTLRVDGQTLTITQEGVAPPPECTYSVTRSNGDSGDFPASGGTGSFTVTTSRPECSWVAQAFADWITFGGQATAAFRGTGTATFTVAPSQLPVSRQGRVVVAGREFTIEQRALAPTVLTGTVTNSQTGEPIAGARVEISEELSAVTDAGGSYTIPNAPPGSRTVQTSATGFVTRLDTVNVVENRTTTFSTSLTPATPTATPTRITFEGAQCGGTAPRLEPGSSTLTQDGFHVEGFWGVDDSPQFVGFVPGHFHSPSSLPAGVCPPDAEFQHFVFEQDLQGLYIERVDGGPFTLNSLQFNVRGTTSINGFDPSQVSVLIATNYNPAAPAAAQFTRFPVSGSGTLTIPGFINVSRVFISSSASVTFDNIDVTGTTAQFKRASSAQTGVRSPGVGRISAAKPGVRPRDELPKRVHRPDR